MTSLEAAQAWCHAVLSGRAEQAWRDTEHGYRRVLADRLAEDGYDLNDAEVVRAVLEQELPGEWRFRDGEGPLREEWQAFAREHGLPEEGRLWGWLERPRKVAADCELVQLVDATSLVPEGSDVDRSAPFKASERVVLQGGLDFYMRRSNRGEWLLAGLNEFPPDWLELDPE